MIKKRIVNIVKLTSLIGIRQGYFLVRNWYNLIKEPFLTIKTIKEKQDKSQIFLIIVTAISPVYIYAAARIVWDLINYGRILWMTGNVFMAMGIVQLGILGYLAFWTLQVLRKDR